MKKVVIIFIVSILAMQCNQSDPSLERVPLDKFRVEASYFENFMIVYRGQIENLNQQTKDKLQIFLNDLDKKNQDLGNGRISDTNCNCPSNQSSCSASTAISSCCVCWDPTTHEGACGTYWGIASCRTESKDKAMLGRESNESRLVDINATNLRLVISFLSENNVDVKSLVKALEDLEAKAIV